jgi:hypothetical protein
MASKLQLAYVMPFSSICLYWEKCGYQNHAYIYIYITINLDICPISWWRPTSKAPILMEEYVGILYPIL